MIEIVIVDDVSSDNTVEVVEYYRKKSIYKTRLFRNNKNIGAGENRNTALKKANGQYVLFLDSDDTFKKNSLDTLIKHLKKDVDVIVFDAFVANKWHKSKLQMFFSRHIRPYKIDKKEALVYIRGCTWGKLYRKSIILNNNIKFGKQAINEDLVFTKTAIAKSDVILYLNIPLYMYFTENSHSLMHQTKQDNFYEITAYNELVKQIDETLFQEELNSIYFIEVLYSIAKRLLFSHKTRHDIEEFKRLKNKYNSNDKYYHNYSFKFKCIYHLACRLFK